MKLLAVLRFVFRFLLRLVGFSLLLGIFILALSEIIITVSTRGRVFPVDQVPPTRVAIVFGAGLTRTGGPSAVLRDRVEKAAELYKAGKVSKLLMSGDNRFVDYNEPAAMKSYALELGVPEKDIVLDFAGRRTYDTCYRAKHIFGVEEAILVTQSFHMPRALFTCKGLGLQVNGVAADVRTYGRRSYAYWYIREIPASIVAIWEVWISHPLPVLGNPEPIGKLLATRKP
jgi:SanA protein